MLLDTLVSLSIREGDTPAVRQLKQQFIQTGVMCLIVCIVGVASFTASSPSFTMAVGVYINTAGFGLGLLHCVVLKSPPMVEVVTSLVIIGILVMDLGQTVIVGATRTWSLVVVVMDWRLLMGAGHRWSTTLIGVILVYLFITQLNRVVPFGLTSHFVSKEDILAYMCDDPPCDKPVGLAVREYLLYILVFVVDYLATRFFSESLRKERRQMEAAIETAGKVARALADFDLEGADAANQGHVLPSALSDAFGAIVCNLRLYRPYLPESCLPPNDDYVSSCEEESHIDAPASTAESASCTSAKQSCNRPSVVERNPYRNTSVTLMVVNVKQFLAMTWEEMRAAHGGLVSLVGECVRKHNGVVDGFSGDRTYAVYNGSKACRQHALSACRSAIAVCGEWDVHKLSVGIATSNAHCGVLGSDLVRRYSTIGKVGYLVHIVERWARQRGIPIMCTEHTYRDVAFHIEGVIEVTRLVVLKTDNPVPLPLWQVLEERGSTEEAEWMYQLEEMQHTGWSRFNTAVKKLHAEGPQKALDTIDSMEEHGYSVEWLAEALRKALSDGSQMNCDLRVVEVGTPAGEAAFPVLDVPHLSASGRSGA